MRRRAEIARIVAGMPAAHRSGLVAALREFTEAGEEPSAGQPPDAQDWWARTRPALVGPHAPAPSPGWGRPDEGAGVC